MKRFFTPFFTLLLLFFVGCSDKSIDISQVKVEKGILYKIGSSSPYSGDVITMYSKDKIKQIDNYVNGKLDGYSIKYRPNSTVKSVDYYKGGKFVKSMTRENIKELEKLGRI